MRVKNKIPAALLANETETKQWVISIRLPRDNWVEMRFSQKDVAVAEFNRIKTMGVYGGQWLQGLELNEQPI